MRGHRISEIFAPGGLAERGVIRCECGWSCYFGKVAGGLDDYAKHVDEMRVLELRAKVSN